MALNDILVHMDQTRGSVARVDAALRLARQQGARVTGLYVVPEPTALSLVSPWMARRAVDDLRQSMNTWADDACAGLRGKLEAAGLEGDCEIASVAEHETVSTIAERARFSDAVVVGQSDPDEPAPGGHQLAEQVVLTCGRPALVVPYIGLPDGFARRVLVAWDGGREAARALGDAIPILRKAETVRIIRVHPGAGSVDDSYWSGNLRAYLERHGVTAEVVGEVSPLGDVSVAELLLARAADFAIDLLVMGAYGHSRMRELVLGGVTREVFAQMAVPVFMAH